jgi:5-formyltetrahydrofolate cyclo-ligase
MNMGLGMSELLLIATLVLLLFGSKELPRIFREMARLFAKLKMYSDKIKRELDEAIKLDEPKQPPYESEIQVKKKALRASCIEARDALPLAQQAEKSMAIWKQCMETQYYKDARAIMMYISIGSEVATRSCILEMLGGGKRVIVPYCRNVGNELGIAEIRNMAEDVAEGSYGIPEPVERIRNNFFKSDLQLAICPAVAFDIYGSRLGRGKGCYDIFLKELKGKVPLVGFAFDRQIQQQNLPFDYHDIPMDQVITESGLLLKKKPDTD